MNMFARFDENQAMTFQDIKETKRYGRTDGRTDAHTDARTHTPTDNVKTVYPPQTKFAGCHFVKNYFFLNQTPSCICSMCLHCIGKVSNCSIKSCIRSWSAHEGTIFAYTKALLGKNCLSSHSCHFVKYYFFWTKLLHAYVQCVYIV